MDEPPPYEKETSFTEPVYGQQGSPIQESRLIRGLQIPSRTGYVTSGFRHPKTLEEAGIKEAEWLAFTNDITRHATLSSSQWGEAVGTGVSVFLLGGIFITWFAIIPAAFVSHQMRKHREQRNLRTAIHCGWVGPCLNQWNESTFMPRGLFAAISLPDSPDYNIMEMDLSVSKVSKGNRKKGKISVAPADAVNAVSGRESRDLRKASRKRRRAMRKCRIVIMPLSHAFPHDGINHHKTTWDKIYPMEIDISVGR